MQPIGMSVRRKQPLPQQTAANNLMNTENGYYHSGTGFSVTPNGAIGFSKEVEDKMSLLRLAEKSTAGPVIPQVTAAAAAQGSSCYSNRDAFDRMNITCQSIFPDSFQYTGAPSSSFGANQYEDEGDEEDSDDGYTGASLTVSRDLLNQMENSMFTGAAPSYAQNASKIVELNDKLKVHQDDKILKQARRIIQMYSIHQAYLIYKTMDINGVQITRKPKPERTSTKPPAPRDGPTPNIFKAHMQLKEENPTGVDHKAFDDAVKKLLHEWASVFVSIKNGETMEETVKFKTFKFWHDHMKSMDATESEKKHCKDNMDMFMQLMNNYTQAIDMLKKLERGVHPFYADPHYQPLEWKEILSKAVSKKADQMIRDFKMTQKNKGKGNGPTHATGAHNGKTHVSQDTQKAHVGGDFSSTNGGNLMLSSDVCQCGPHAIPVLLKAAAKDLKSAAASCASGYCQCEEGPLITQLGRQNESNSVLDAMKRSYAKERNFRRTMQPNRAQHVQHNTNEGRRGKGRGNQYGRRTGAKHIHIHTGGGFYDPSMEYGGHVF